MAMIREAQRPLPEGHGDPAAGARGRSARAASHGEKGEASTNEPTSNLPRARHRANRAPCHLWPLRRQTAHRAALPKRREPGKVLRPLPAMRTPSGGQQSRSQDQKPAGPGTPRDTPGQSDRRTPGIRSEKEGHAPMIHDAHPPAGPPSPPTARNLRILQLLVDGNTRSQTAAIIGASRHTVTNAL